MNSNANISIPAAAARVAEQVAADVQAGRIDFPSGLKALASAGFVGYAVDFRTATKTFFHKSGGYQVESFMEEFIAAGGDKHRFKIRSTFDVEKIRALLEWAKSGDPEYTYAKFAALATQEGGCAFYNISFTAGSNHSIGLDNETHTEHFPAGTAELLRSLIAQA
ncbi:hypothetical protein [Chromobacterium sp. IIBBL 290-4]|uniref:hypothetical protein n=1 Tax=Chromobacterium sp. IIBBL 290-4 TaxID=2953890 RepID=UPI0020B6B129|nr:hypothetical protein [Chromobacterium sp. IIBBL 290-4]UTH75162.1 hypothetical protein NKT35_03415 [Chromobacterium sp. IIBBL 290-4]